MPIGSLSNFEADFVPLNHDLRRGAAEVIEEKKAD
jgi:hypothetical protein